MKMSEYVQMLQDAIAEHGDLEVFSALSYAPVGAVQPGADKPSLCEIKQASKRERYTKTVVFDTDVGTGQKVFRL